MPLLELAPELLELVAQAMLNSDLHAFVLGVSRFSRINKHTRQVLFGNAAIDVDAARKVLTYQLEQELLVAAGRLSTDYKFPYEPWSYKQAAQEVPAPRTVMNLCFSKWRHVEPEVRGQALMRQALMRVLRVSGSLTHLRLNNNNIGDEGAQALAAGVAASGSLTHLDLYSNCIGDEGAKALAAGVAVSRSLTHLDLAVNKIGVDGAKAIAAAVGASGSLTHLNLNSNKFGCRGAAALAASVAASGSLARLELINNNIGDFARELVLYAVQGRQGFKFYV